jgi:hypothetical protein
LLVCTFISSAGARGDGTFVVVRWVRLVVPTSTSVAPALAITSGMRKAPPISTSSPRETMTSSTSARQRGDREQHRGRVVVDHGGGLGAGQRAQQLLDNAVAVAAAAGGQVVLEVVGAGHHRQQVLQRAVGQQAHGRDWCGSPCR